MLLTCATSHVPIAPLDDSVAVGLVAYLPEANQPNMLCNTQHVCSVRPPPINKVETARCGQPLTAG